MLSAKKKRPAFPAERFCVAQKHALLNFNKLRIARADYALRIYEAVHVNCDPAAVHECEVCVPDQSDMVSPESLNEELLRMPPKTEHFAMTRLELLHVHPGRLIHVRRLIHVSPARARTHTRLSSARFVPVYASFVPVCARFIPVYARLVPVHILLSAALHILLSTYICARLRFCRFRFCLSFVLLLRGTHLLPFRRRSRLCLVCLPLRLRLLWLRCLA